VNLSTKKVLLIGCGSVGGLTAYELVRSGILNLTLVDPDKFTLENTYRHVMGNSKLNKYKASALKEDMLHKYPYLSCNAINRTIEDAIEMESLILGDFDLIVVAIGTPTTELWLNELIQKQYKNLTAIYTWLEPLGIGGHTLLVTPTLKGCFECLYSSEDEESYLFNRASFAAPGQQFASSLTGCNNLFTPYGSLDASSTAAMAVKTALRFLLGKEKQSALYSWKGESEEFLANGFVLSDRYSLSQEQLNEHCYSFTVDSCKVCSN
jgi:molybdopterin/thiamine biosynthesis adenylyltransferase